MLVRGWENDPRRWRGRGRVSRGTEDGSGLTMKQSSMSGSVRPSVNGWLGVMPGYDVMCPVGMPVLSRGRYWVVERVASVPSMVVLPLRLK
jgi:hypothetical protein